MRKFVLLLLLLLIVSGCKNTDTGKSESSSETAADQKLPKIVAFGNSLTAGLGLPASQSYPALLQEMLHKDGYQYEVVNAGVSGDTTAGGLRRIDWSLDGDVKILILELGANDILRGQPVDELKKNLAEIITKAKAQGIQVVLAGMESPTNAGPEYRKEVHQAYRELAREHDVVFIPFFLKDVVADAGKYIQEDGSHPNKLGNELIARMVYQTIKPIL